MLRGIASRSEEFENSPGNFENLSRVAQLHAELFDSVLAVANAGLKSATTDRVACRAHPEEDCRNRAGFL